MCSIKRKIWLNFDSIKSIENSSNIGHIWTGLLKMCSNCIMWTCRTLKRIASFFSLYVTELRKQNRTNSEAISKYNANFVQLPRHFWGETDWFQKCFFSFRKKTNKHLIYKVTCGCIELSKTKGKTLHDSWDLSTWKSSIREIPDLSKYCGFNMYT